MSNENETNVSKQDSLVEVDKEFAERFKSLFDTDNFNKIAEQLKISHVAVQNYWHGKRLPTAEILKKIVKETNVSINWLLTGKGEKFIIHINDGDLKPEEFLIDYSKVADRIIEGLKAGGKTGNETEIVEAAQISHYVFEPFRNNGYHGQGIYEVLALRTNLSLNWIITGKGEMQISSTDKELSNAASLNLTEDTIKALRSFIIEVINEKQNELGKQNELQRVEVPYVGKVGGIPEESNMQIKTHKQEKKVG
jgi:transcriptional regulator with XRE-family HTH domain